MADISNLNVQINQNQINQNQINTRTPQVIDGGGDIRAQLQTIRSGTLVEGQVLAQNADGSYTVRVNPQGAYTSQTLLARATLDLIVGERFRAVWDSSGSDKVPILRLSQGELSFLSKLPLADRELATALMSRGMPLSDEVLITIREAWRRMGSDPGQLSPLLELWGRDLPMTPANVQIIAWYMGLTSEYANGAWAKIRKELKERSRKGENPLDILGGLKEGEKGKAEIAQFLQAHSLLLRAPRGDVDPSLLVAPLWPVLDDMPHILARVFVGRTHHENDRKYWQVGFNVEGARLGFIGGDIESDGSSYILNLYAEELETCELMKHKRHVIRKELEDISLSLQYIGISRIDASEMRRRFSSGRGLDVTA